MIRFEGCELCSVAGGETLVQTPHLRVVLVDDAGNPGFCRVIWNDHVAEMTDLEPADRSRLMQATCKLESVIRSVMQPDKINLASLGNVVPHLHWHVIPRWRDDAHFPAPIWAAAQRALDPALLASRRGRLELLKQAIVEAFEEDTRTAP